MYIDIKKYIYTSKKYIYASKNIYMRNITFSLAYYDREPHCTIDTLAPRACAVQGSQSSMRRPASTPAHSHLFTFCLSRDLVSANCAVWFPVIVSG